MQLEFSNNFVNNIFYYKIINIYIYNKHYIHVYICTYIYIYIYVYIYLYIIYVYINKSKVIGFDKNLHNITDNKQYRKEKTKLHSDVVKVFASSNEEAPESGKTVVDLKNIQSILLRDKNLNSSKIQNSPPDIWTECFIEC